MSNDQELGTLVIVVLKAKNLHDRHLLYKQDVFAQATLNGVTKKTPVDVKGGQHPEWDVELRYAIMKEVSEKYRKLEVACYSQQRRSSDLLGKGGIDITDTLKTGEFDEWVSLSIDGVTRGEIYLEMTYFPHTPAPASNLRPFTAGISRRPSKLPPPERLSRPPKPSTQEVGYPKVNYSGQVPVSSSPSNAPTTSRRKPSDSALPPVPKEVSPFVLPGTLLPGQLQPRKGAPPLSLQEVLTDPHTPRSLGVPSVLRPGIPNSSRRTSGGSHSEEQSPSSLFHGTPAEAAHERGRSHSYTLSPPSPAPPRSSAPARLTNSNVLSPATSPYYPAATSAKLWSTDNLSISVPLSFPSPVKGPPPESYGSNKQLPSYSSPPGDLPDPYLQARYQTPLPLPVEFENRPQKAQPPNSVTRLTPDINRVDALRSAEVEAARRKEQTDRDLELALQLDRELNT